MNSAANSLSTAASRSRAALPSDYRRVLEASNLPIEQAVAIADMVELALRSEPAYPCVVDASALRYAREFVADPDRRAQVKVQLHANGWPQLADLIDEAVVVSHELLRIYERSKP